LKHLVRVAGLDRAAAASVCQAREILPALGNQMLFIWISRDLSSASGAF
jgi:hypothetical protein